MEHYLRKIVSCIDSFDKRVLLFSTFILVFIFGCLDYLSGFEFSFSLFYLLPVSIAAWFINRKNALLVSAFSAVTWFISNNLVGETYSHPAIGYWNTFVRLSYFTIVALLLTLQKKSIQHERNLSRTDFVTGITNYRAFYELAFAELLRARRYKHHFTVAYIDLDDFKKINDRLGHSVGDVLLRVVAETLRTSFRNTDIIARIGGDEFIVLLPETDEVSAEVAITKARLFLLKAMEQNKWEVTFSIGVITFYDSPASVNEIIRQSDELMYTVKANGKNNIKFSLAG